ncbi:hypothetical protein Poli38472_006592 [Pythium oligandrum]|uniref:Thioredoxin-like fold domain-containing protein n=1 Tax=Pythium oligandrum TaxID=41045 RepID=A0A8K1FEF7_PYTOL|nr:hypothetical protein Poli38472_006592 [Pythium oligandrum]|eukprot:TMW56582.1 hypothetical protein Poli38472_006592 [Pythium oligandrum]
MEGKRVVGLFFTTSGCRRCQLFSPILETVYRNMTLNMYRHLSMQDEMEVVMVTMDAKVSTFREYLLRVPFKALPLYRRDLAHRLVERYQVTRMPSLVFIDANGEAINLNGRELLEENFTNLDRFITLHVMWASKAQRAVLRSRQPRRLVTTLQFTQAPSREGGSSTSSTTPKRPLEGIRVVECGHLIAGPFAATILGYFGAEVIKIEPPTGDQVRGWRELDESETSLWWYSVGRNKKSVSIDMRQSEGRDLVRDLVLTSDVLIENFRPGRMEKWGLGPDVFEQDNPSLVYARVSGFGQDGPYSSRPGFASVCEAIGGFRYLNGFPDRPPVRQNLSVGDTIAGIHAALGIVIALLGRERVTQRGQVVDIAIYESMFNLLESVVPEYDYAGVVRECSGSTITGIVPSNTYLSKDMKHIVLAANTETLFSKLMHAIGRSDMASDVKYSTNAYRVKHQTELDDTIGNWTATKSAQEIEAAMDAAGIPFGRVYSVEDIMSDEQYNHRQMFERVNIGDGDADAARTIKIPAILPKLQDTPGGTTWAGRKIGQDTRDVLRSILHQSDPQIDALVDAKVVFEP